MSYSQSVVRAATLALGLGLPLGASAQEVTPEDASALPSVQVPREEEPAQEEAPKNLSWEFRLTSEVYATDNASFRALEETQGNQAIRESDDRHNFGFTSLSATVRYEPLTDTTFRLSGGHSGLWGSNQLGGTDRFGGLLSIYELGLDWHALDGENFDLHVSLGRQPFSIGGAPRDYFFRDAVDGLVVKADMGKAGAIRALVFDLFASQGRPPSVNFTSWHSGHDLIQNMRGETNTVRTGVVYENTSLVEGLELRGFGLYAEMGGGGSGADRTDEGTMGNFTDRDFAWLAGTRVGYGQKSETMNWMAWGEFARSGGIDRKRVDLGYYDVAIDGNALGAGVQAGLKLGSMSLDATGQFFRADGPQYARDGVRFSHGFVSFKGAYVGGLNAARYLGFRPSAHLDTRGLRTNEHEPSHRSGTQTLHAGLGLGLSERLKLDLAFWNFADTGTTNLEFASVSNIGDRLPIGLSQEHLEAQRRLGKSLGNELNATLGFEANEQLKLYTTGGVFLPGDFYAIEVSRNVGLAIGSDDPQNFWVVAGGATLSF